jgi:hypothetical protein
VQRIENRRRFDAAGFRYLCYPFFAEDEAEIELRIQGTLQYAELQSLVLNGPIVLAEKSYLSLFSPGKLHYELMIEVQEKVFAWLIQPMRQ